MKPRILFNIMESLNQQILANRQWLPAINTLYQKSARLNCLLSSTTSTLIPVSGLLYSADRLLEHNRVCGDQFTINRTCRNIFDILKTEGFGALRTEYPTGWNNLITDSLLIIKAY